VLVVAGERDALTGVAVADRFAAAVPDGRVVVLPGAGHFPWVDEPVAVAATVETFLASE
jgi:pimeloyl-ACP methyl ester carboxylesterase